MATKFARGLPLVQQLPMGKHCGQDPSVFKRDSVQVDRQGRDRLNLLLPFGATAYPFAKSATLDAFVMIVPTDDCDGQIDIAVDPVSAASAGSEQPDLYHFGMRGRPASHAVQNSIRDARHG